MTDWTTLSSLLLALSFPGEPEAQSSPPIARRLEAVAATPVPLPSRTKPSSLNIRINGTSIHLAGPQLNSSNLKLEIQP